MAIRLNTVEYAFYQDVSATRTAGTSFTFDPITVDIPETTNRKFVSAYAQISCLDAVTTAASPTSFSFGLRIGGTGAYTNRTITATYGNSGENHDYHFIMDVSNVFITGFTGTSHQVDASFALAVSSYNNASAKLVLSYEYNDTDVTRIKTVRIPIDSSTQALDTTLRNIAGRVDFQIPALDSFLPEASKAYKDIFFESYVNEGTTAATVANPTLGFALDAEASSEDFPHEDVLVSARLYRRIWKRMDMNPAVEHEFKAKTTTTNMPFRHMGSILNVTYTYDDPSTSRVLNSLLIAAADEFGAAGATTSADNSRFTRTLQIPDENPVLQRSAIQYSYIDAAAVTINIRTGSQAYTAYSNAANVVCGGYVFMHRIDASSRRGTGLTLAKDGTFTIDWYTGSVAAGSSGLNVSAALYLNYEADKSPLPGGSANNPHTIITLGKENAALLYQHKWSTKPIGIPEPNYWIMGITPIILTRNATAIQYMTFDAERGASTNTGAGWQNLYSGALNADAEAGWTLNYARARTDFKRWPGDLDGERMDINNVRTWRFMQGTTSIFNQTFAITYHTETNYVSGAIAGYTGNGSGISIYVYDSNIINELVYETSTAIGGQWGFTWYNTSTNFLVGAYQDSTHQGTIRGYGYDASLNISFGSESGATPTSWVF
jgi:hypothetical protein